MYAAQNACFHYVLVTIFTDSGRKSTVLLFNGGKSEDYSHKLLSLYTSLPDSVLETEAAMFPCQAGLCYLLKEVWPEVCVFVYAHVYGRHTEIVNHYCVFNLLLMGILFFSFLVIIHVLIAHV